MSKVLTISNSMDIFRSCGTLEYKSSKDEYCAWKKKIMIAARVAGLSDIVVYPPVPGNKAETKGEDGNSSMIGGNKKGNASKAVKAKNSNSNEDEDENVADMIVDHTKTLLAFSLILNQLDNRLTKQMDSVKEGDISGLLQALDNKFNPLTSTSEVQLKVDLFSLRMQNSETVTDFAFRVQNIASDINHFGEQNSVTDGDMQYALYQGCTSQYRGYIKLLISSGTKKSFEELVAQLRTFESLSRSGNDEDRPKAYMVGKKKFSNNQQCHLCKEEGHFVKSCPYNLSYKSDDQDHETNGNYCVICRNSSHSTDKCRYNGLISKQGNKEDTGTVPKVTKHRANFVNRIVKQWRDDQFSCQHKSKVDSRILCHAPPLCKQGETNVETVEHI